MNNDDYVRLSRVEEYQTELKHAKFDLTKVLVAENGDDTGYDDLWGNGIKMNWNLVPLEDQKCHINWRQAIDDDGSGLGKLGSWLDQGVGTGVGYNMVGGTNNPEKVNLYLENQKDMTAKKSEFSKWVDPAIQMVEHKTGTALTNCANDLNDIKNLIGSGTDIDPIAVLAASVALDITDYKTIIDKYRSIQTSLGSMGGANPALVWTAYGTEVGMVKRYIDGTLETYINGSSDATVSPTVKTIPAPTIIESGSNNSGISLGPVKQIVMHHYASPSNHANDSREQRISLVRNTTKNSNGKYTDYHFVIFPDGEIYRGSPEEYYGAHCGEHPKNSGKGGNGGRIGISFVGWYATPGWVDDKHTQWFDKTMDLNQAQQEAAISLIAYLMQKYNLKPMRKATQDANINNDPNVTLIGHYELYEGFNSQSSRTGCPGINVMNKIDSWVEAINTGVFGMASKLWTEFVKLIEQGLEKQGTTSTDGLGLFPNICFLYVNILSHQQDSQSDGGEWAFPFSDEDIRNKAPGKGIQITSPYAAQRSAYEDGGTKHSGVDLQPVGLSLEPSQYSSHHFPVRAMKDGIAYYQPDACNSVAIVHSDGTVSRYLHLQNVKISNEQKVKTGEEIGEIGGAASASNLTAYPYHLHVEMMSGTSPNDRIGHLGQERGINPVTKWSKTNFKEGANSGLDYGTYTA